ncbi:HAD family hydrolase [Candidatus Falkowbacteria bacterium]|nr:HAD family hydrolase [Candidatus Falkowbacteria bacterium]
MAAVAGLIFDKDGTLYDFQATWCAWSRGLLMELAEQDERHARALGAAIGYELGEAGAGGRFAPESPVIAGTVEIIAGRLLPHLPAWDMAALVDRMNVRAALAPQTEAVPLRPLLAGLRADGLKLGVATNDSEAPARVHLTASGVEDLFDFIAGFDSGFGAKPAPGQLLAFAEATGLVPETVVMVGDSRHDLEAGRAAGMRCLGVLTGLAGADDLAPHAEAVLPDIGALPRWLAAQTA